MGSVFYNSIDLGTFYLFSHLFINLSIHTYFRYLFTNLLALLDSFI